MGTLGTLLNLSFESYVAQLLIISIMLYVWPWLLFGGIVLRSTFFTRKIGGLLIAIVLGAVVVFPTLFGIEYVALGNGLPGAAALTPYNTTYGFNTITNIPTVSTDSSGNVVTGNYLINFYVTPSMQQIAEANNCWPKISTLGTLSTLLNPLGPAILAMEASGNGGTLAAAEMADIFYLLNPLTNFVSVVGQVSTAISSSVQQGTLSSGTYFLPAYCPPQGAFSTTMQMLNAYGIIGVTSYFLPLLNLIMTLSAIIGMSGLMGGDTTLEGLSRFV